jgi:hypothetical protein
VGTLRINACVEAVNAWLFSFNAWALAFVDIASLFPDACAVKAVINMDETMTSVSTIIVFLFFISTDPVMVSVILEEPYGTGKPNIGTSVSFDVQICRTVSARK